MTHDSGVRSLVTVIDDDASVRESLPELLRQSGYEVETFPSAEAFLGAGGPGRTKCLVLDVAMPGMSGPELHRELQRRGQSVPVVFITAHGDRALSPRLIEQGAVECLCKPFTERALLAAVGAALRVA
jgi:FixJ family two-component response regulator